jgi:hypothetical protein
MWPQRDLSRFWLSWLDPLVLLLQKWLGFPIFRFWAYLMKVILSVPDEGYFERTWWRLFCAYMMKVILSVHDEGYLERTWWRLFWAYLIKVILSVHDEGYFERTWWRLFHKRDGCPNVDIYVLLHRKRLSINMLLVTNPVTFMHIAHIW